jgi:hypothetical protein
MTNKVPEAVLALLPLVAKSIARKDYLSVQHYIEKIERFFGHEEDKLYSSLDKTRSSDSKEDQEAEDWYFKFRHNGLKNQVNIFVNSSVVTIYSYFERALSEIVDLIASATFSKTNPRNYKVKSGSVILNKKTYLEQIYGIDFSDTTQEWEQIERFRFIRNIIVHHGGEIPEDMKKDFKEISQHEDGVSEQEEKVIVEALYLKHIMIVMERFYSKLCPKLNSLKGINRY